MKKLLAILVLGSFVACNNGESTTEKDSTSTMNTDTMNMTPVTPDTMNMTPVTPDTTGSMLDTSGRSGQ